MSSKEQVYIGGGKYMDKDAYYAQVCSCQHNKAQHYDGSSVFAPGAYCYICDCTGFRLTTKKKSKKGNRMIPREQFKQAWATFDINAKAAVYLTIAVVALLSAGVAGLIDLFFYSSPQFGLAIELVSIGVAISALVIVWLIFGGFKSNGDLSIPDIPRVPPTPPKP